MENCKHYTKHLDTINAYIGCLYRIEGCECGGLLHVMIDDDNIEDHFIKWTLDECNKHPEREEAEIGKLICNEYLKLSMEQRRLLAYDWLPYRGCSCDGRCENCYIENPEADII